MTAKAFGVPMVQGSQVRLFGTQRTAKQAARDLGWPVSCAVRVQTRFCVCWALGTGVDLDKVTGLPYLSRERFGELYRDRNPGKEPNY